MFLVSPTLAESFSSVTSQHHVFFLLVSSEQQNAEVFILLCQFHMQLEYNILMLQTYIFSVLWDKQKSGSRQQTKLYFVHLWLKYTAEWTLSSFSALGGALLSSQPCGKIAASTLCWILQPNLPTGAIIKLDKGQSKWIWFYGDLFSDSMFREGFLRGVKEQMGSQSQQLCSLYCMGYFLSHTPQIYFPALFFFLQF